MTRQSTYNVGIYVRLSQEDMREGESLSIENQKKMLTDYVSQQPGWNLVEVCEDDGYSGTNFDRPGIIKILDDAKSGKINLILVKDLSRFGRNYIEVGQYIDFSLTQNLICSIGGSLFSSVRLMQMMMS